MPSFQRLPSLVPSWRAATLAATLAATALLLCGCQGYTPQPLKLGAPQWTPVDRVAVDAASIRLPAAVRSHRFDPSDGLDMTEVETLAVVNNPDLRLARADLKIAQAQAFAAGLLPDPQVAISAEHAAPPVAGLVNAFNTGIAFDLGALVTRTARRQAADADARKTDMALLWQEWQVASQARQLFIKQRSLMRLRAVVADMENLQTRRVDAAQRALDQGNLSADAIGPYQVAREDWRRQLAEADRQLNQTRHDLAALLGLAPDTVLDLVGPAEAPAVDEAEVSARLAQLSSRRPDLVALQAGYAGQDDRFRAAILAQFPAITIGPTRLRDNTGVYSTGFAASLNLPILSANRGNIAVESATRDKLRLEYDNRLRAAHADVDRLLSDERLLEAQWQDAVASLPALERTVAQARVALASHQISIASFVDLQTSVAARRIEILGLEQSAWTQRVALEALLGDDIAVASSSSPDRASAPQ